MSDDIWVSQKVEHRASGAYFEKDSDGDIILCGYYLNKQCIESFKEFLHRVLRELGDGDASAAPEATPAPSVLASMKRVENGKFVDAIRGDSDASAAPEAALEAVLEDIFGSPRIVSKVKLEATLELYKERCEDIDCDGDGGERLEARPPTPNTNNCVSVRMYDESGVYNSVWLSDAEQWARFANEVFALLGGEFVVARKVSNDNS